MPYLILFGTFFFFGCFCLSGGSSLLQFYIDELVVNRAWMSYDELANFMAISQATPGPIGVNLATFIGFRQQGVFGGLLATVGLLLPSFIMMSLAVRSYATWSDKLWLKGLLYGVKPVAASLIFSAFVVCLGMSVFDGQLPLDRLPGLVSGANGFPTLPALRPAMVALFLVDAWLLYRKKLSIFQTIFLSAGIGALLGALPLNLL